MVRKFIVAILYCLIAATAYASSGAHHLSQRLDSLNTLRHSNSAAAIRPLYNLFVEASARHNDTVCARTLTYLGWALFDNNHADFSLQLFEYASSYCNQSNTELIELINLGIGAGQGKLNNYVEGERILNESLNHCLKSGNLHEAMVINLYLSDLYSTQKKNQKANERLIDACKLAHNTNDLLFESAIYCNRGAFGATLTEAEEFYKTSIALCQQCDNKATECYAYCNLAELYYKNNLHDKALRMVEQAEQYLRFLKSTDEAIAQVHLLYSKIYCAQKDYTSAYKHSQAYIEQTEHTTLLQQAERAEYRTLMKDIIRECELHNIAQHDSQQSHTYIIIIVALILVIVLMAAFGYLAYLKHKQHQQLHSQEQELQQLQHEQQQLNNELRNNRAVINFLYTFYLDRNTLLSKISAMLKEGYKMNLPQLVAHLKTTNSLITQHYNKLQDNKYVNAITCENKQFVEKLLAKFPHLSEGDRQMAIYYRMGLSTGEIAGITGKQAKTVTMARYRLRKELDLDNDTNLFSFLNSI